MTQTATGRGSSAVMVSVPVLERNRIVSGMRWTVWLSVLAAPFGYGTTVLLARAGPNVLGTYGLLMVYISVVSSLMYLGGDTVTIRFIPIIAAPKRMSFLGSYYLIICGSMIPWLAMAALFPRTLQWLFGSEGGASFQFGMLCTAPIYVAAMMAIAALKSVLDMFWAQMLARVLTVVTFLAYGVLSAFAFDYVKTHYVGVIWGVYLSITGITAIVGFIRLGRLEDWGSTWRSIQFFLPRGFWRYTLGIQQVSGLGFLLQRLDMILVLNYGGLTVLGKYVAILAIAGLISVGCRFFLDTLLPGMTTLLARHEVAAASEVFATHLRVLFAVSLIGTSILAFYVGPLTSLLGDQYRGLKVPLIVLIALYGAAAPGSLGGTLLSSIGKQQRSVWVGLVQLGLFVIAFLILWPRYDLLGAVLASGGSMAVCNVALLIAARYAGPIRFFFVKDYTCLILVASAASALAIRVPTMGMAGAFAACILSIAVFLFAAGYSRAELRTLAGCFLPGREAA